MAEYGVTIANSAGARIIDYRYRSMEIIAAGSVYCPAKTLVTVSWPSGWVGGHVFVRSNPAALMMRGSVFNGSTSQIFCCDRNTTLYYVIGGFKADADAGGGYGLAVYDAAARLCFSTNRSYVRLPYKPDSFTSTSVTSSVSAYWDLNNPVGAGYRTAYTANTYFCWRKKACWSKDAGADWHWGFGLNTTTQILIQRVDVSQAFKDSGLGWFMTSAPGTADIDPSLLLTTEFTP